MKFSIRKRFIIRNWHQAVMEFLSKEKKNMFLSFGAFCWVVLDYFWLCFPLADGHRKLICGRAQIRWTNKVLFWSLCYTNFTCSVRYITTILMLLTYWRIAEKCRKGWETWVKLRITKGNVILLPLIMDLVSWVSFSMSL